MMTRLMHWEALVPQLIWVAVYGAAAFFLLYVHRQSDLNDPDAGPAARQRCQWIYLSACGVMVLVLLLGFVLEDPMTKKQYVKQFLLFQLYQIRVFCTLCLRKARFVGCGRWVGIGVCMAVGLLMLFFPDKEWVMLMVALAFQVDFFCLLYTALRSKSPETSTFQDLSPPGEVPPMGFRFSAEDFDAASIPGRLLRLFRDKKIFLRPNLTLDEVAFELGTNKTYLSKCVNIELRVNFREFVNAYRVQEAMLLFEADPNLSLMELCQRSGFKNQSSFTFSFKLNTGQTPGEWCRDVKQRKMNESQ